MTPAGDQLDLSPIGAVFTVLRTREDTEGRAPEMEWTPAPHSSGTPVHIHPAAVESYRVLEVRLDIQIDGKWTTLRTGDSNSGFTVERI